MPAAGDGIDWIGCGGYLLPVALDKFVGGASVALMYWIGYRRAPRDMPLAR